MSVMISRAEGVTVYTVNSNPKSKCPLLCQILGTLCYSPVCSVSLKLKQHLGCALTALATIQIMVGIMNLGFGALTTAFSVHIGYLGPVPFGFGGAIIAVGIVSILAEKFPSPCLVVLTAMMNIASAALAITTIVLYSVDMVNIPYSDTCRFPERHQYNRYYWATTSADQDNIFQRQLEAYRACEQNLSVKKTIRIGLGIMMIVLAVLHLCVAISWCVLSIKALRKKKAGGQDMEDPELRRTLLKEEAPDPVC